MFGRHEVNIFCEVPPNTASLFISCKSRDDDLGEHELRPGQSFSWHFRTNLFKRTLFYCSFWWGPKLKQMDVFNGEWDSMFKTYYRVYNYVANGEGIFLSNDPKNHSAGLGLVTLW
ncbi:Plant self-incompatibility protein S1 family [Striga hermonthica]|uniref:S-protein homolog n=1 Tax=Striga hermonthica TaxID=68872 RepID=A0A9N7RQA2_STRHE|nr:Plant self-incompatibility protein S1 family [Striga hermonthica]